MWQRSIFIGLAVLAGLVLLAGCGQSLDSLFSTYNVDMTGKTIDAAGGVVHIIIPPGAVSVPTVLTIGATTDAPTGLVPGTAYQISAVGIDSLNTTGQVTLHYQLANAVGLNPATFKIYELQPTGSGMQWVALTSTLDAANQAVTANFTLFGTFAILGS